MARLFALDQNFPQPIVKVLQESILFQPLELAVLIQMRLTLVVALEAGHNPVKATGLLFAHLTGICRRTRPHEPQLWRLQARTQAHVAPWEQLKTVAVHQNADARSLFAAHRLDDEQLAADPLA